MTYAALRYTAPISVFIRPFTVWSPPYIPTVTSSVLIVYIWAAILGIRRLLYPVATLDGKTLISGSDDHSIRTWSTTTWTQIAVLQGHTNIVYAIAISPNDRILASASADNTARSWNLDNNSQPISLPLRRPGTGAVACVSFSADGKSIATVCDHQNTYMGCSCDNKKRWS
jgi:WD40 repeat protein